MSSTGILATHYIFIDTSVFESENFMEGARIRRLFDLANQGHIHLLISQITYQEVIARMGKQLNIARKYMEQNTREMDLHLRILRNIEKHKDRFPLAKVKKREDLATLTESFDIFLTHGKVEIFETTPDHRPIFARYFNNEAPFNTESKKHEFPDAFAIAMLEEYCTQKDISCYALSLDRDILAYVSRHFVPENDLASLIDRVNRHIKEQTRIDSIARTDAIIKARTERFLEKLQSQIEYELTKEARQVKLSSVTIEAVHFVNVSDLQMNNYSIINLFDRDAEVEFDVSFDFTIGYDGTDYSEASYDREDEKWYGEKAIEEQLERSMRIPVQGRVLHTHADGSIGDEIELLYLNYDQDLDLEEHF